MARMVFRCPICGTMVQGDPRFPPLCPNAANHPVIPPGQLPQQPIYLVQPRPGLRQRIRANNMRRMRRALKLTGILFACMLACLVLLIAVRAVLAVIDPPRMPSGGTTPTVPSPTTAPAFQCMFAENAPQQQPVATSSRPCRASSYSSQPVPQKM